MHGKLPIPEKDPPTKEQRLELVKYRLVPGASIERLSRQQAEGILRKNRSRRRIKAVLKNLTLLLVCASAGYLGYLGWVAYKERHPVEETKQPIDPQFEEISVSLGEWEKWISDPAIILVSALPDETREILTKQTDLFKAVLAERETSGRDSYSDQFQRMVSEFPSGEDVRAGFSGTTHRSTHASAGSDYASAGGSSYTSGSTAGTRGVLVDYLNRYGARVRQLKEEFAADQLESLIERLDRDVEQLESRGIGDNSPRGAQVTATLRWLKGDVRPYLVRFSEFVRFNEQEQGALAQWIEFEQGDKVAADRLIASITEQRVPLAESPIRIPIGKTVLLEAEIGSRKLILFPDRKSEVRIKRQTIEP